MTTQFSCSVSHFHKAIARGLGGCLFAASLSVAPVAVAGQVDSFDVLHKGGYTLFFRHAQADWRNLAAAGLNGMPDPCAGERQLTEAGRMDARALGAAVKSLNLTIADVTAANMCRMQETAKIAFGAARTQNDIAARPGTAVSLSAQVAALERLVKPALPERAIRIIIGDYEVAQALYGVTLAEGDALVLKTGADGKVEAIARMRVGDWRMVAPIAVSASTIVTGSLQKF